jgi:hypothetical protein
MDRVRRGLCAGILVVATPASGQPHINELVPRPRGGEGEWIEILNPGPGSTDLTGWTLRDGTGKPRVIIEAPVLSPQGHLVLASRPESLRVAYALHDTVLVLRPDGWPVLNDRNAGPSEPADVVVLARADGTLADSVAYFESWLPPEAGRSLERARQGIPGTEAGAWGWSMDPSGATPGRINSLAEPGGAEPPSGSWSGPEFVAPGDRPAVFRFALPEPGTLAVWLLDRADRAVAQLQVPRPVPSVGTWVWGSAMPRPPRSGDFYLCFLWHGPTAGFVRQCRRIWVSP